jgi:hypothetical protein
MAEAGTLARNAEAAPAVAPRVVPGVKVAPHAATESFDRVGAKKWGKEKYDKILLREQFGDYHSLSGMSSQDALGKLGCD